jgi:hypothetical protein
MKRLIQTFFYFKSKREGEAGYAVHVFEVLVSSQPHGILA